MTMEYELRSPDTARVKGKMMYASTKDFFKSHLEGLAVELQVCLVCRQGSGLWLVKPRSRSRRQAPSWMQAGGGPVDATRFRTSPNNSLGNIEFLVMRSLKHCRKEHELAYDVQVSDLDDIGEKDIREAVISTLTRK